MIQPLTKPFRFQQNWNARRLATGYCSFLNSHELQVPTSCKNCPLFRSALLWFTFGLKLFKIYLQPDWIQKCQLSWLTGSKTQVFRFFLEAQLIFWPHLFAWLLLQQQHQTSKRFFLRFLYLKAQMIQIWCHFRPRTFLLQHSHWKWWLHIQNDWQIWQPCVQWRQLPKRPISIFCCVPIWAFGIRHWQCYKRSLQSKEAVLFQQSECFLELGKSNRQGR